MKGSRPIGGEKVVRSSSLISRELVRLTPGETVRYKCDTGFRVYGLLVNHGGTSCILQLRSPAGTTTFDMRFSSAAFDWSAFVAAVLDPVGEGDIELSILDERDVTDGMHRIGGHALAVHLHQAQIDLRSRIALLGRGLEEGQRLAIIARHAFAFKVH